MRALGWAPLLVAIVLAAGCSKGIVKGPEGQENGIGMKIPVLGLLNKDTYESDNFTVDNLDSQEMNPFQGEKRPSPDAEAFSRFQEDPDSF
jgi:hypothetical protein